MPVSAGEAAARPKERAEGRMSGRSSLASVRRAEDGGEVHGNEYDGLYVEVEL